MGARGEILKLFGLDNVERMLKMKKARKVTEAGLKEGIENALLDISGLRNLGPDYRAECEITRNIPIRFPTWKDASSDAGMANFGHELCDTVGSSMRGLGVSRLRGNDPNDTFSFSDLAALRSGQKVLPSVIERQRKEQEEIDNLDPMDRFVYLLTGIK